MKYISLFLITILICTGIYPGAYHVFADTTPHHQVKADTDTVTRKQSLSVGLNYGSDVQFFGRTGPHKYPFMNADIIYNAKSGFFIYGSAYKVFNSPPAVDETDVGAGYYYRFSSRFTGNISYTRFIFDPTALIIKSASANDINFNNSYDWKVLKTGVIMDYLFGDAQDFFITLNVSKYFETNWSVFDDKDYLSFNPGISLILGTQNFVQKYAQKHPSGYDDEWEYHDPYLPPPVTRFAGYNSEFQALNYSIKIPVAYNRPHYTFELAYKYSVPENVEGIFKNHKESFFNLTFYYLFY
jgi:hypothetical protein